MSAILSADDLNDFISPGVACIKPVETLPRAPVSSNPYEVTTEDKLQAESLPPAQISLTDCLACSGCVTSAEAVLVSLQSHAEVLNTLDSHPSIAISQRPTDLARQRDGKIFVASVSPQTRASLAAAYGISERKARYMIEQLLAGEQGLAAGGRHGSRFTWVIDTNVARDACWVLGADEVMQSLSTDADQSPKKPILTSACPGWICYAEKTHPHILPHLSRLKSPQALLGTLLKSFLSKRLGISPDRIWHVAIMPCFDKKLEASRAELTDESWIGKTEAQEPVRDVDCVITTKELLMLAESRGIDFASLPTRPLSDQERPKFPDPRLHSFLFRNYRRRPNGEGANGTSGGYLQHILQSFQAETPGSTIRTERGRNADVTEFIVLQGEKVLLRTARYYGFRNIQNLVRKLKPAKASRMPGASVGRAKKFGRLHASDQNVELSYVEVMACPGGCTNGGGQIKIGDAVASQATGIEVGRSGGPAEQKQWLAKVDEAYFSADSEDSEDKNLMESPGQINGGGFVNGISPTYVRSILAHWSSTTGIDLDRLACTSYRMIESDVGSHNATDTERVVALSSRVGGGW